MKGDISVPIAKHSGQAHEAFSVGINQIKV